MLNTVAAGDNLVLFGDKAMVDGVIATNVSEQASRCHVSFYFTGTTSGLPKEAGAAERANERFTGISGATKGPLARADFDKERVFGNERRLILIQVTALPPSDAYASYRGQWYSIQDRDVISKRSLALVTQIDTIQALPMAASPLLTTVNVGPK